MNAEKNMYVKVPANVSDDVEPPEFDINGLRKEDLKYLREKDAFVYYSIPGENVQCNNFIF